MQSVSLRQRVEQLLAERYDGADATQKRTVVQRWLHAILCEEAFGERLPDDVHSIALMRPLCLKRGMRTPYMPLEFACDVNGNVVGSRPLYSEREWADIANPTRWRGSRLGTSTALAQFAAAVFGAAERAGVSFEVAIVCQSLRLVQAMATLVFNCVIDGHDVSRVLGNNADRVYGRHCTISTMAFRSETCRGFSANVLLLDEADQLLTRHAIATTVAPLIQQHGMRIVGIMRDEFGPDQDVVVARSALLDLGALQTYVRENPTQLVDRSVTTLEDAALIEEMRKRGALRLVERKFEDDSAVALATKVEELVIDD